MLTIYMSQIIVAVGYVMFSCSRAVYERYLKTDIAMQVKRQITISMKTKLTTSPVESLQITHFGEAQTNYDI